MFEEARVMKLNVRSIASLSVLVVALSGCSKKDEAPEGTVKPEAAANAEAAAKTESAAKAEVAASPEVSLAEAETIVEEHDGGSVAWNIGADGQVKALVKGPDNKPIRENVSASLVWKAGGEPKDVPLTLDPKTGLFVAVGPKLEADLTQIDSTITVEGKPWSSVLYIPAGGTAALVAGAKASVELPVPEGRLGPHRGVIQVVGPDRLELVADVATGEVRAYVLDADFNAVAVGDRSVTLGVVADAPTTVALASVDGGAYLSGKWNLAADPLKLTVALRHAGQASYALVGFLPSAKIRVGASAPRIKVRIKTGWEANADALADIDAKANAGAVGAARVDIPRPSVDAKAGARADIGLKAPSVKVKVEPPRISVPKVSFGASAGASAGFGAKAGAGAKFKAH
jgi:hypothetical protein